MCQKCRSFDRHAGRGTQNFNHKESKEPTDRPTDCLDRVFSPCLFQRIETRWPNSFVRRVWRPSPSSFYRLVICHQILFSCNVNPWKKIDIYIYIYTCTIYSNIYNTRMKLGLLRYVNVETFRYKFSHRENEENCLKPFFSFTHQSVSQSLTRWRAHDRIFLPGKSRRIGRVFPGILAYHVFRDKSSPLFERIVTDFLNFHRKFFQRHFNAKKIFTLIWYWQ